jgi:hypothetical protein
VKKTLTAKPLLLPVLISAMYCPHRWQLQFRRSNMGKVSTPLAPLVVATANQDFLRWRRLGDVLTALLESFKQQQENHSATMRLSENLLDLCILLSNRTTHFRRGLMVNAPQILDKKLGV